MRVNRAADAVEQAPRLGVRAAHAVHFAKAPEKDVLADAHGVHQIEFLIDDTQSPIERFNRRCMLNHFPVEDHPSGILRVHTGQNLHERGLSRSVLPYDSVHTSPRNLNRHVVQRLHAGERFAYVLNGKDDSRILRFHRVFSPFE
ncbi:hypothetical protein SDC9_174012 [bioreactor metagenome]|uniref:Uncharacterized protein n=1 Tax=bioreactor metagenome TaxID=1076179 RepID=A0A645GI16_9ZZZZ